MRIALKRALDPDNAAPELARVVARALATDPEARSAPALVITLEEPSERPELRAHVESARFTRRLDEALGELLGPKRAARALHVHYAAGESHALSVAPSRGRAGAARLDWGSGAYAVDGSKLLLAVGRGPIRKRFPGARNDVVLEDRLSFVSRDAFALEWDPGRDRWRLNVDEIGRGYVEIERNGSTLIPQLGSIPLEHGDVIAVTGGPEREERLEIRFTCA